MNINRKNDTFKSFIMVFVAISTISQNINAQDFELVKIGYANYPSTVLKEGENDTEYSLQEFGAAFNIPCRLKNKSTAILNGLSYAWVENSTINLPIDDSEPSKEHLHTITYQLMIAQKLSEKWRLIINLRPTISSDLKTKVSSDDFILRGAVFASNKINEHFSIGGGVASTMRFGQPRIIPILSFNYQKGKHSIRAVLPVKSSYNYSFGIKEKLKIGLRHHINGAQYNITSSQSENYDIPEIDKIRYSRANIGATINYQLTKLIQFEVYGGTSVRRRYELLDDIDNTHLYDLKNLPFVQFGIAIVPPIRKTSQ